MTTNDYIDTSGQVAVIWLLVWFSMGAILFYWYLFEGLPGVYTLITVGGLWSFAMIGYSFLKPSKIKGADKGV